VCFSLGLLLTCQARATFHLWTVNEIYSNADGSVQFIELHESSTFNGENLLAGHFIRCTSGLLTNTFIFPTNLPSTLTAGKSFVIGTANLASIPGGVTPDYVFTNAGPFLFAGSGTVQYAGVDTVTYTNLPSDGVASMVRSGAAMVLSATNSPQNFAGGSNSIVPVRISSAVGSGINILLTFPTATGPNGTAGPQYEVLTNGALKDTNWAAFTNVTGDGTGKTVAIPISAPQLFFRLRVP
jgi:serralysin